jgi:SlyX protein
MSDLKALSDRIDVLETRLTFQDETIETLNQTITAQWQQIDTLTRQIALLKEKERPPHRRPFSSRVHRVPDRNGYHCHHDHSPDHGRDLLGAAAAR